jgi:hypothetical protein
MLRASGDKPNFSALPADGVVQRYYQAIDELDLDSLEACGSKEVLGPDWNYVMNMMIVVKTRMAYEKKNPRISLDKWLESGKPALVSSDILDGISGLALVQEGAQSPDFAKYRASYSFWTLERKDEIVSDPDKTAAFPSEEKRVDELSLERSNKWKGWRITKLDRRIAP